MCLSDKELLSFCDLTRLNLEFANNKYVETELTASGQEVVTLKYHTIHSLLEKEYKGIKDRVGQGLVKPAIDSETLRIRYEDELFNGYVAGAEESFKQYEESKKMEEYYYSNVPVSSDKALGSFYKSEVEKNESIVTDYIYQSKKEMKKLAPVMMELFDRYNEAVKKGSQDNHVGKFLTEWEVIHVADDYLLVKQEFESVYEEQIQMFKEPFKYDRDKDKSNWKPMSDNKKNNIIEKLENAKKEYPTREKVEDGIAKKAFIDGAFKILDSPISGVLPGIPLKKVKSLAPILRPVFGELNFYDLFQSVASSITGKDVTEKGVYKVVIETIAAPKNINVASLKKEEFEYSKGFDLTGTSIRVGVFRNPKLNSIVIAIANKKELAQVEKLLKDGKIPKEIMRLNNLINSIKSKYPEDNVMFTGVKNAGKIANILELVHSKDNSKNIYSSRGYFYNFPSLLPTVVDLTQKDLEDVNSSFNYLTNQELILKGAGTVTLAHVVLVGSALFTGGQSILIATSLAMLLEMGVNVVRDVLRKKSYTEYLEFLEKERIISKLNHNGRVNYESGKMVGEVIFEEGTRYEYKGISCDLSTFLQLSAYELLFDYSIMKELKTTKEVVLKKGGIKIKITLDKNSIKKIEKTKTYESVTNSSYPAAANIPIPIEQSEEDIFGFIFFEQLKVFQALQRNYKAREESKQLQGYYFEENEPKEIRELSYKIKDKKNEYFPGNIVPFYFPFINEKGILTKELTKNYVASVVRSSIENDKGKKYYEETLEEDDDKVEEPLYAKSFSTVKHAIKSDETDKLVMRKVKKLISKGKVMHKEKLLEHLEPKGKIREYYEVEEESETRGYLTLGIFNENLEYKTEEFGHVYHEDHLEGRVIEEKLVLYGKKEDLIKVTTTGVSSSAILRCDNGSIPSELKVTSQIGVTTNGLLDATEGDKAPFVNILPFGKCSLNRDGKGQPLPCEQFISPSKWSGASRGSTINGMKELISTSKISCNCGGEITILAAISTEVKN